MATELIGPVIGTIQIAAECQTAQVERDRLARELEEARDWGAELKANVDASCELEVELKATIATLTKELEEARVNN